MRRLIVPTLLLALMPAVASAAELLPNPGFDGPGTGWGAFGAAGFHDFFGGNHHASLFADNAGNFGGVFQVGIPGTPNVTYTFELLDVRIEANWDADLRFGLEYYQGDDSTKIGEDIVLIDTSTTGDGLSFSMMGTADPGTVFVRPIVLFDNVNPGYSGQGQANAFVFEASLTPEPASLGLMLIGSLCLARRRR